WDIGALGLAERLGRRLDAAVIAQRYSRLVIDCNRRPGHPGSIPAASDGTAVPANAGLDPADRRARERAILEPYQAAIAAALDARARDGRDAVLVAVHSFTPRMAGIDRPWHAGMLFNRDPRLGRALLELLDAEADLVCAANQPYRLSDADDYTVPVHGEGRGLVHVELEIRQDLIADIAGEEEWAERLGRLLPRALAAIASAAGA
ncbi:MAG: N-formylglutamate amidohydrolase, partial [Gluconacetobacter diazotrophicus]|nr:N-formylglutamate amidohydrolase [Gluconacetobacter diazotrophicus]